MMPDDVSCMNPIVALPGNGRKVRSTGATHAKTRTMPMTTPRPSGAPSEADTVSSSSPSNYSEELEQNSTTYDQITHFSYSTSSDSSNVALVNKICLDFRERPSPTKYIRCKAFWQYVDSVPQLEALKALGWKAATAHSIDTLTRQAPPEIARRRWLSELLKLKDMNLHEVSLAGNPAYHDPCAELVFADMVEKSGCDEIGEFETSLAAREAQRDPKQNVLGYKTKQPPPMI